MMVPNQINYNRKYCDQAFERIYHIARVALDKILIYGLMGHSIKLSEKEEEAVAFIRALNEFESDKS